MFNRDRRIKVIFDVGFDVQNYDEANELNKKLASLIDDGEFLLPLLDEIGENDHHSKWSSRGNTGWVQNNDWEYFSTCSAELYLNSSIEYESAYDIKERLVDADVYDLVKSLLREIMPNNCDAVLLDIYRWC